jgi:hypothetical protein
MVDADLRQHTGLVHAMMVEPNTTWYLTVVRTVSEYSIPPFIKEDLAI